MEGIRLDSELRKIDDAEVLEIKGEIDVYTAPQFKEAIDGVLSRGQKRLIINMAGVTYMDSSGFGALLSATKRLRPVGGTVSLVQCNNAIDRILKTTRLDSVFHMFDSVDDAVAAAKKA
ncbi:MAG: STAS domain-containing protein [Armatimonadetes bacterium]|nr:STAS domain-containing protein [Armatimonadota bacterium]